MVDGVGLGPIGRGLQLALTLFFLAPGQPFGDAFYIITDVPNGMKYFDRAPIKTAMEGDFDTGNVRYKARERYSFGVSDYRGIFGVEGV